MDIARPDLAKKKRIRRFFSIGLAVAALCAVAAYVITLDAPRTQVRRDQLWLGKVEQGTMMRNVRGLGRLVPENVRWIAARAPGRVEEVLALSGAEVEPDDIIVRLSNPELEQKHADARLNLDAARADMESGKVRILGDLLAQKSRVVDLREASEMADLEARIQQELFAEQLSSGLNKERAVMHAKHCRVRLGMEEERLSFMESSVEHQLAALQAKVHSADAALNLISGQINALEVRAGFRGILQRLEIEPGMQVEQGRLIAQVADMKRLKAVVEVQEAQAREVAIGQKVNVDTRTSGDVEGIVTRIDPNVEQGIVRVDVGFPGGLPHGCRAEQSIQGTIELELLENTVFMPRPASVQANSSTTLFRISANGNMAVRVPASLGRSSASMIEVLRGLKPGDMVILSDISRWDGKQELELR